MKVKDQAIVAAALAAYGVDANTVKAADPDHDGQGIYRGAHCLAAFDFSNFRVDMVAGVSEGKPLYETVAQHGKLPKGTKPTLMLVAGDFDYTPLSGEHLIVYRENVDDFVPAVMQGVVKGTFLVAGTVEKRDWQLQVDPTCVLVPIRLVTPAGLVTVSAAAHMLPDMDNDRIQELAAALADKGLTFNDLYKARTVAPEAFATTKLAKKFKSIGLTAEHNVVESVLSGAPVALKAHKKAQPKAKVTEEKATVTPLATRLNTFLIDFEGLKGAAFRDLYNALCDVAKVPADGRQTKRADMIAHAKEIANDRRVGSLVKAGHYAA